MHHRQDKPILVGRNANGTAAMVTMAMWNIEANFGQTKIFFS